MKIAIAGPGELAQFIVPALLSAGHSVVVLTRSPKDWITRLSSSIPQLQTDYSDVAQLTSYLDKHRVEALISTSALYDKKYISIHLNMLAAAQQSKTCKRFIPSEYGNNIRDYPMEPMFNGPYHEPVRQALREQSEIQCTLICTSWFSEFILPAGHPKRIFKEAGEAWVMDHAKKVFTIYGSGEQEVSFVSAADLGTALARLMDAEEWEEYTFLQGQQVSWNQLFDKVKAQDGHWTKKHVTLAQSEARISEGSRKGMSGMSSLGCLRCLGMVML